MISTNHCNSWVQEIIFPSDINRSYQQLLSTDNLNSWIRQIIWSQQIVLIADFTSWSQQMISTATSTDSWLIDGLIDWYELFDWMITPPSEPQPLSLQTLYITTCGLIGKRYPRRQSIEFNKETNTTNSWLTQIAHNSICHSWTRCWLNYEYVIG